MSTTTVEVQQLDPIPIPQGPKPPKKLKPARKQVKAGDVVKTEAVQTGKNSEICALTFFILQSVRISWMHELVCI
jgi:hypothetical protein